MIILPGVLGEAELAYFQEEDYLALKNLINNYIAHKLHAYCCNPEADDVYVGLVRHYLGSTIDGIINNDKLDSDELKQVVFSMASVDIRDLDDTSELATTLANVDEILNTCTSILNPRTSEDYNKFANRYIQILRNMQHLGVPTTYETPISTFKANAKILYQPHEQPTILRSYSYRNNQTAWFSAKRGIEWSKYVKDNNLNERMFL